ncbi:MAG: ACP S-malonyltransferase [Actinobacteria bacterium]|nr:ACP S-malonyltransferase [Actinomycetota bacterium]
MTTAVVFPGQGSQSRGWGEAWRDCEAWSVVGRAEEALGEPLAALLLDPAAELGRTRNAQLAVVLSSLVAWEAARADLPVPVALAGHSLGQVTALMAAGALSFEDGVRLVARRAALTQAEADRRPGRMVALLGADEDLALAACMAAAGACWVANVNAPGQVVVAGTREGVAAAAEAARSLGARRVLPLEVDGAFHTPLMAGARDGFAAELAGARFADTDIPVVSNADARPYRDGEGWRARLADHLVSPVRWRDSLETLAGLGAGEIVEVGPGEALSAMARRTLPDAAVRSISLPGQAVVHQ